MTFTNPPPDRELNEHQQRRLVVTCQYVDRLLGDLERSFSEAQSQSPFGRYANDLAPAEQRLVRDYLARLRTQLLRILSGQGLSPTPQRTGLRWAILTHLAYVDVAVEELKPHYMRGYGAVAPEAAAALNGIVEELHGTIGQLSRYLAIDRTEDLRTRLESIRAPADLALLSTLEELITKYGLVEFRSALATILDTLERRGLELAVFGRVSTGKSSLLNRLLERDVLPVGVTPITAVPTRIAFGREPRLRVRFADAPPRELDVSALAAYASERENPANAKRVLRLVVELPCCGRSHQPAPPAREARSPAVRCRHKAHIRATWARRPYAAGALERANSSQQFTARFRRGRARGDRIMRAIQTNIDNVMDMGRQVRDAESPHAGLPVLLTVDEAADLLRTTRRAIYAMIERRQLPGVIRIRRRVLLRAADLLHWLDQKRAPSPEE
ncbi:MAG: dynamin family protein [Acidobacteria bacterium]|nr:dynamin family protein [Acidobacteriota bacterium]